MDETTKMTTRFQQTTKTQTRRTTRHTPTSFLALSPSSRPLMMVNIFSNNPPLMNSSFLGSRGPLLHILALLLKEKRLTFYFLNQRQLRIDMNWRVAWICNNTCLRSPRCPTQSFQWWFLQRRWGRPAEEEGVYHVACFEIRVQWLLLWGSWYSGDTMCLSLARVK